MNDIEIIELYFARNEQAIMETKLKYGRLCHKIAYNILNNNEDAEECVNDIYIGIWNKIPPTKPNNFMAFICKIARNLALKKLEARTRQKRSPSILVSIDELSEVLPDESVTDNVENEELGILISKFLYNEKEHIRNVFIRKYYFFDSIADIAKCYNFTESKVKNILHHTRQKLKNFLIKENLNYENTEDR